jgi:hypothetical protein
MFAVLEREGLVSRGKLNRRAVTALPFARVIDVADAISSSLNSPDAHRVASPYVHSASLGLGGAPAECEETRCRLDKIGTLARFAGLYSDGVVVHNFFADYASVAGHPPERDSEGFRRRVADDITVALSVRPLIDAGLIRLFSPPILQEDHICMDCLAKQLFGTPGHGRFRKVFDQLSKRYLSSISVDVYYENDFYHIVCDLPEELFEHGGIAWYGRSADVLSTPATDPFSHWAWRPCTSIDRLLPPDRYP